ncbi:hypothetical protein [Citrobacter portucalensis]|uniref:hypothetical protein n=1 Tax=Citrobacter portucalensis TaxID=1639133 RepID=UPI0021631E40|nr:hypothetical protein [Citrobacter portucalensis]MCS0534364.1 hypothetical protein [Citrobacter portucalensis]
MDLVSILKDYAPFIAIIALFYAVRNYRRKSGTYVRGQFAISSYIHAEDKYISNIVLENFKDKSVIIFKIFVRVGHNYYIEMDNFENEPKILKPYESLSRTYKPVDFYSLNLNRIKLDNLLGEKKSKVNIVLSTSHGKYVVKKFIKRWDPIFDFFRNHLTAYILPMSPDESIGHFGSDFSFLVKLTTEDGFKKIIPIYPTDINYPRFENFRFTSESLSSQESLDSFLLEQIAKGKLKCTEVEVIDAKQLRLKNYGHMFEQVYEAEHYNWFIYNVIGRLHTIFSNIRTSYINRKRNTLKRHLIKKK